MRDFGVDHRHRASLRPPSPARLCALMLHLFCIFLQSPFLRHSRLDRKTMTPTDHPTTLAFSEPASGPDPTTRYRQASSRPFSV